jgi:hypothetical protein
MTLIFPSRELDRQITLKQIWDMELDEVRQLHVELTMAVQGMDDAIQEAQRLEYDAGIPFDRDWMHKARKKRRITIVFASEARRRLFKLEGIEDLKVRKSLYEKQRERFQQFRHDRLREMLKEELGPGVLEEVENDAHEAAEADFQGWLKREKFDQIYQP